MLMLLDTLYIARARVARQRNVGTPISAETVMTTPCVSSFVASAIASGLTSYESRTFTAAWQAVAEERGGGQIDTLCRLGPPPAQATLYWMQDTGYGAPASAVDIGWVMACMAQALTQSYTVPPTLVAWDSHRLVHGLIKGSLALVSGSAPPLADSELAGARLRAIQAVLGATPWDRRLFKEDAQREAASAPAGSLGAGAGSGKMSRVFSAFLAEEHFARKHLRAAATDLQSWAVQAQQAQQVQQVQQAQQAQQAQARAISPVPVNPVSAAPATSNPVGQASSSGSQSVSAWPAPSSFPIHMRLTHDEPPPVRPAVPTPVPEHPAPRSTTPHSPLYNLFHPSQSSTSLLPSSSAPPATERRARRVTALFRSSGPLRGGTSSITGSDRDTPRSVEELLRVVPSSSKPAHKIKIGRSTVSAAPSADRAHVFHLTSIDGGRHVFQTPTAADLSTWIRVIDHAAAMFDPAPSSFGNRPRSSSHSTTTVSPIFGVELATLAEREGSAVPLAIETLFCQIESRHLREVGIYRVSGAKSTINALKKALDTEPLSSIDVGGGEFSDPHTISGVIKQWYRDMPEPVVPFAFYHHLITAEQLDDPAQLRSVFRAIIHRFPEAHYVLLRRTIQHLTRVAAESKANSMPPHNLGLVFGTSLLNPPGADPVVLGMSNIGRAAHVVKIMIEDFDMLFDEPPPPVVGRALNPTEAEAEVETERETDVAESDHLSVSGGTSSGLLTDEGEAELDVVPGAPPLHLPTSFAHAPADIHRRRTAAAGRAARATVPSGSHVPGTHSEAESFPSLSSSPAPGSSVSPSNSLRSSLDDDGPSVSTTAPSRGGVDGTLPTSLSMGSNASSSASASTSHSGITSDGSGHGGVGIPIPSLAQKSSSQLADALRRDLVLAPSLGDRDIGSDPVEAVCAPQQVPVAPFSAAGAVGEHASWSDAGAGTVEEEAYAGQDRPLSTATVTDRSVVRSVNRFSASATPTLETGDPLQMPVFEKRRSSSAGYTTGSAR